MYSVVYIPITDGKEQQKYIFMQTDLLTIDDGNKWIDENIRDDEDGHWVMRTSSILKFSKDQCDGIYVHSNLKFEEDSN